MSSNEVEDIITGILELKETATVYGVEIPHTDGRAGMVAIPDEDENVDLQKLHMSCVEQLPKYSRPLFVRLVKEVQMTSMLALMKQSYISTCYMTTGSRRIISPFDPQCIK